MDKKHNDHHLITSDSNVLKLVFLSSYGLSIVTFATFAFAMIAVPISGANAPNGGILYPYLETIERYPRDYIWQYLAMFMICIYLVNIIFIKAIVNRGKQSYIQIASSFALIASAALLINYYVQVSVIPVSLMKQEHEGIALITQYNPHGLFIALEELGYVLMAISFAFLIPVFRGRYTKIIAVIYLLAVIIAIVSFVFISIQYGFDKLDRYEVIIVSTIWLVFMINGILTGNKVRKLWKCTR